VAREVLAEWMLAGNLHSIFGRWTSGALAVGQQPGFLRERVTEVLGLHYQMAGRMRVESSRGVRKTPLHDLLARQKACFGSKNGWERPNWFATGGVKPALEYSFGRQNWFECHSRSIALAARMWPFSIKAVFQSIYLRDLTR